MRKLWAVPELGVLVPLVICALLFYSVSHSFLGYNSVASMLRAMAFVGIIAVGQTWLMIAGEIDLSVGSVAGLCAVVASWLMSMPAGGGGRFGGWNSARLRGWTDQRNRCGSIWHSGLYCHLGHALHRARLQLFLCKGYPIYPFPTR